MCAGSVALDTTRTPFKTVERVLGGSASYFAVSAGFFAPVSVVSAVGGDFPQQDWNFLASRPNVDLQGVQRIADGRTMFFDSSFGHDFYARKQNVLELGVLGEFEPVVPTGAAEKSGFVYLASMPPAKQRKVIEQVKNRKLVLADTIQYYVENDLPELKKTIALVDGMVLNDAEARLLTGEASLLRAGKKIWAMGPKAVVVKKGEHGCLLFFAGAVYPFPAFPLEEVTDPTGAGDSFAGGLLGCLAKDGVTSERLSAGTLRKAIAFGTVMGSFAVEDFSLNALAGITKDDIDARVEQYRALLHF